MEHPKSHEEPTVRQPMPSDPPADGIDRLTTLPTEILSIIFQLFGEYDLIEKRTLSHACLVNRCLRNICLPLLFRSVAVTFSEASLENLLQISLSTRLAPLVRELDYEVPDLLSPGMLMLRPS
jgi:hypothetical protein